MAEATPSTAPDIPEHAPGTSEQAGEQSRDSTRIAAAISEIAKHPDDTASAIAGGEFARSGTGALGSAFRALELAQKRGPDTHLEAWSVFLDSAGTLWEAGQAESAAQLVEKARAMLDIPEIFRDRVETSVRDSRDILLVRRAESRFRDGDCEGARGIAQNIQGDIRDDYRKELDARNAARRSSRRTAAGLAAASVGALALLSVSGFLSMRELLRDPPGFEVPQFPDTSRLRAIAETAERQARDMRTATSTAADSPVGDSADTDPAQPVAPATPSPDAGSPPATPSESAFGPAPPTSPAEAGSADTPAPSAAPDPAATHRDPAAATESPQDANRESPPTAADSPQVDAPAPPDADPGAYAADDPAPTARPTESGTPPEAASPADASAPGSRSNPILNCALGRAAEARARAVIDPEAPPALPESVSREQAETNLQRFSQTVATACADLTVPDTDIDRIVERLPADQVKVIARGLLTE